MGTYLALIKRGLVALLVMGSGVALAQNGEPNEPNLPSLDLTKINADTPSQVWAVITTYLAEYGLKLLGAIAIFVIGRWVARLLSKLLGAAMTKAKIDETLVRFVKDMCYVTMLAFVVLAALAKAGVQTTSAIALIGAAGLAVGLALQGSLANFAAGVLMLIFKPIRVGDFVEVAGTKGTVKEVGIFTTTLNSPDNVRVIVPNGHVMGGNISNYTINGTRRVDMVFGVSYEDDLQKTKQVIEKVIGADERILADPAPMVAVSELADSSVNFVVRPWVNVADYWNVYFDLTAKIKVALEDNGITIPFPQRDVHLKDGNPAVTTKSKAS